jgi:hypothetical protein
MIASALTHDAFVTGAYQPVAGPCMHWSDPVGCRRVARREPDWARRLSGAAGHAGGERDTGAAGRASERRPGRRQCVLLSLSLFPRVWWTTPADTRQVPNSKRKSTPRSLRTSSIARHEPVLRCQAPALHPRATSPPLSATVAALLVPALLGPDGGAHSHALWDRAATSARSWATARG